MHNTSHEINSVEDAARKAVTDTIFSPRFYTTDFAAMDAINIEPVRAEWDAMMAEYEGDNNHDHFQRTPEFATEVAQCLNGESSSCCRSYMIDYKETGTWRKGCLNDCHNFFISCKSWNRYFN